MDSVLQTLVLIALVGFVGWRLWNQWQGAGAYSEQQDEARKAWKESFQKFKQDKAFTELMMYMNSKYKTTFDKPADNETYQVAYMTLLNEKAENFLFEDIAHATFLIAYLKGGLGKKQISLNLKTKDFQEHDLGGMAYSAVVPYWAGN